MFYYCYIFINLSLALFPRNHFPSSYSMLILYRWRISCNFKSPLFLPVASILISQFSMVSCFYNSGLCMLISGTFPMDVYLVPSIPFLPLHICQFTPFSSFSMNVFHVFLDAFISYYRLFTNLVSLEILQLIFSISA